MEKAVLNTASGLIHDEVDVLFGQDHGASLRPESISRKEEGTSKKKTNDVKNVKDVKNYNTKMSKRLNTMKVEVEKKSETDLGDKMKRSQILQEISDCIFE